MDTHTRSTTERGVTKLTSREVDTWNRANFVRENYSKKEYRDSESETLKIPHFLLDERSFLEIDVERNITEELKDDVKEEKYKEEVKEDNIKKVKEEENIDAKEEMPSQNINIEEYQDPAETVDPDVDSNENTSIGAFMQEEAEDDDN
ncbi:unnamed protein product [Euphydryas editha]|uniref:Uncharacterized protein n=1 Tax=Euphydryas editha TaxID=104508 RepID=A0AAU9UU36_EUPED|nr:unnamed protein product [Euphydryas editha]